VRSEKAEVLAAIQTQSEADALRNSVRGQYRAAKSATPSSRIIARPKTSAGQHNRDLRSAKTYHRQLALAGVPFYLRTGKALGIKRTEVAIKFKQRRSRCFATPGGSAVAELSRHPVEPTEGITLQFNTKVPGPVISIDGVEMNSATRIISRPSRAPAMRR